MLRFLHKLAKNILWVFYLFVKRNFKEIGVNMKVNFNPSVKQREAFASRPNIAFGSVTVSLYGVKSKFMPALDVVVKDANIVDEKRLCLEQSVLFERGKWRYSKNQNPQAVQNDVEKYIYKFQNNEGDVFYYFKPRKKPLTGQDNRPEFTIGVGADLDEALEIISCKPEVGVIKGAWEKLELAIMKAVPKE